MYNVTIHKYFMNFTCMFMIYHFLPFVNLYIQVNSPFPVYSLFFTWKSKQIILSEI